jgi:hypothetical protein
VRLEGACLNQVNHNSIFLKTVYSFSQCLHLGFVTSVMSLQLFSITILIKQNIVRFEVLTAVTMKNTIFWDVMPCNLAEVQECFGEMSVNF